MMPDPELLSCLVIGQAGGAVNGMRGSRPNFTSPDWAAIYQKLIYMTVSCRPRIKPSPSGFCAEGGQAHLDPHQEPVPVLAGELIDWGAGAGVSL
jgi:hypothetical protein